MRRLLKIFHTLGAVGLMGGYATDLVLGRPVAGQSPAAWAALRGGLDAIATWVLVPSLVLVLLSGLFAIAANLAFAEAPWVWAKAGSGVLVFEATLHLQGVARSLAELSARASGSEADAAEIAELLRGERGAVWTMLAVCAANVVLGIWRPRRRSLLPATAPEESTDGGTD